MGCYINIRETAPELVFPSASSASARMSARRPHPHLRGQVFPLLCYWKCHLLINDPPDPSGPIVSADQSQYEMALDLPYFIMLVKLCSRTIYLLL